jgi:hypothetical protein
MLFLQFIVLPHNYLLRNCYLQHSSPDEEQKLLKITETSPDKNPSRTSLCSFHLLPSAKLAMFKDREKDLYTTVLRGKDFNTIDKIYIT